MGSSADLVVFARAPAEDGSPTGDDQRTPDQVRFFEHQLDDALLAQLCHVQVARLVGRASGVDEVLEMRFVDEPLKHVVAEINRHRTQPIILTDAQLADQLYTGTVYEDRIDDWLGALQRVFPVRITKEPNGEVRLLEK